MPDEKARLGDKLRDAERGREDQFFAKRDQELLGKLRDEKATEKEAEIRALAHMRCPRCGQRLQERLQHEVRIDECPDCGGMWLDKGEFEELASREGEGWFGGLFRARKA